MADVKTDLLSLQYSQNFAIEGLQEANVDLGLPPASAQTATVFGVVTDGSLPVADATVKRFDSAGLPFMHTLTDASGTYSLGAVKDGYRLSDAAGVTLSGSSTTQMDLTLKADATLALGAIAGVLSAADLTGKITPLGGAKISLRDTLGAEVAVTYTAADGEFAFYDIADGVYTLMASAEGYQAVAPVTATILGGSIANVEMSMTVDLRTYSGTVSGLIRNGAGQAVAGCFVGLYRVVTDAGVTREQLVSVTKTNAAGKYMFGGVGAGEYLVKAKLDQ